MTSMERIGSVLQGKFPDRPPFAFLISLMGLNYVDASYTDYYRSPDIWFTGQSKLIEALDPDIVTGPFVFPLEAEAFGSMIHLTADNAPNVASPICSKGSDIENLQTPDITHPSLEFILKATERLVKEYKGTKAIAPIVFSPADLPALLFGIEGWIDILLFQKEWVEAIMSKTMKHFVMMANTCLEMGADFVVTTANFMNPSIVTDQIFQQIKPYLNKAFQQVNGPVVVHHGGCKLQSFMHDYSCLPNVIALVIDPRESLVKAREEISNETILMGNLDGPLLNTFTHEKITALCNKILRTAKSDPRFIFSTSNADIPVDTPLENLELVVKLIKEYTY